MATGQTTAVVCNDEPPVEYRDCPGHPGYRVGSDGSVWSCRPDRRFGALARAASAEWRLLTQFVMPDGHLTVHLQVNGRPRTYNPHRLVLEAFVGPCPDGMECCHNDGNPANNVLANLRWDTRFANAMDKYRHGTMPCGSRHVRAKLSEIDVQDIRTRLQKGESRRSLAKRYGVGKNAICRIEQGVTWKHLPATG